MSVIARGARNALRNKARTGAVILVLAIAIGLTLSMLVAGEAVRGKLSDLRDNMDATVTVLPGFEPGADVDDLPGLDDEELEAVSASPHVAAATATVGGMLQPPQDPDAETEGEMGVAFGPGSEPGETDLESGMDAEAVGAPEGIAFPIPVTGTTGDRDGMGAEYRVTEGELPAGDREAVVSDQLAEANGLQIGDTFSAYGEEFTVVGIAESESEFDSVGVVMTVEAVREFTENSGYDAIAVEVDDVDNVEAAVDAISDAVGPGFDVRSNADMLLQVSAGLSTVADITTIGFWVALGASALIVFFTLAMTVRERRKEVGVLKAIGSTNRRVIVQFGTEAIVLVSLATIIGLAVATLSSGFMADVLVATNAGGVPENVDGMRDAVVVAGPTGDASFDPMGQAADLAGSITASVGWGTLGIGALVALGIAVSGSAVPAWLIARVRPAEVLRGE